MCQRSAECFDTRKSPPTMPARTTTDASVLDPSEFMFAIEEEEETRLLTGSAADFEPIKPSLIESAHQADYLNESPIMSFAILRRETLSTSKAKNLQLREIENRGAIANVSEEIIEHLYGNTCFVIHYGVPDETLALQTLVMRANRSKEEDVLKVVFCGKAIKRGPGVIPSTEISNKLIGGTSVIYTIEQAGDCEVIADVFTTCAEYASKHQVAIDHIRFLILFDTTINYLVNDMVRDRSDGVELFKAPNKRVCPKMEKHKMCKTFFTQVEMPIEDTSDVMVQNFEREFKVHMFRNTLFPAIADPWAFFPFGPLGLFLAYHPFGSSHVIGAALLPEGGDTAKKLIESWVNMTLGSSARFIHSISDYRDAELAR